MFPNEHSTNNSQALLKSLTITFSATKCSIKYTETCIILLEIVDNIEFSDFKNSNQRTST